MRVKVIAVAAAAAIFLFGCGSDSSDEDAETDSSAEVGTEAESSASEGPEAPEEAETSEEAETPEEDAAPEETETPEETPTPEVTGPAPGVSDDAVKIGIAYVDTDALNAIGLNYNLGEYRAIYEALFADINASGGIAGRQLDAAIVPVDPTSPIPAEEVCLKLAEDEDAFIISGFWLRDTVLCPLDLYETAVVGGSQTPERVSQAKAPWLTWEADSQEPEEVVTAFAEMGELDGTVAVFSNFGDVDQLENHVLPTLEELGIEPVEVGIVQAPPEDQTAVQNDVQLIGQRFEAAGADTVLIVGPSGVEWPRWMIDQPYDPQLLFTDRTAGNAFVTNAETSDTTILEGALFGGQYGPNQAVFDEATMQECIATVTAAGVDIPPPSEFSDDDPSNQPYQAAFQACRDVYLIRAWLEAAGENLNYGTLELAVDGLAVSVPGDPVPRTYGPPPSGDGDPVAYIFGWNEAVKDFELIDR